MTLDCLDRNARVNSHISRYTLPLGVVFNKDGAAIYQIMVVVFFAKYRGIDPDVWDLFIMGWAHCWVHFVFYLRNTRTLVLFLGPLVPTELSWNCGIEIVASTRHFSKQTSVFLQLHLSGPVVRRVSHQRRDDHLRRAVPHPPTSVRGPCAAVPCALDHVSSLHPVESHLVV